MGFIHKNFNNPKTEALKYLLLIIKKGLGKKIFYLHYFNNKQKPYVEYIFLEMDSMWLSLNLKN